MMLSEGLQGHENKFLWGNLGYTWQFCSLPYIETLEQSKLKTFACNLNFDEKFKLVLGVENGVKMLVTSIFSFSDNVFRRFFSSRSLKLDIVW